MLHKHKFLLYFISFIVLGHDYAYLESLMPSDKSGLCTNAPTARYLIRYGGLTYDPEDLSNDEDRCRYMFEP